MARILVVDDDPRVRQLLRHTLEIEGFMVLEADNGMKAIEVFRTVPVALMILDIVMAEKDGLETIQELRQEFPEAKIIAISGGGTLAQDPSAYLLPAEHLGAMCSFAKPLDLDKVLASIKACVTP